MRVLVLGGDGFCGWPTALHLSARGWEVAIVDNLSRRRIDEELGVQSLTPIRPLPERLAAWRELTGREIAVHEISLGKQYEPLLELLQSF
ncbi:MAG: NAD-dependent dehydratase, partial [Phenylobacterium sp.]|nr:NAD-dependent dehydratase [Phenylobacterium sp.]